MTSGQRVVLAGWAVALAVGWATVVIPAIGPRIGAWAVALVAALLALAYGRVYRRPRSGIPLPQVSRLPGAEHPLALVCGEHLEQLFGRRGADSSGLRHGQDCSYLAVGRSERLGPVVAALIERQPWRARQLRVLWVANPGQMADANEATVSLRNLRRQLAQLHEQGLALPLLIVSYLPDGADGHGWFICRRGQGMQSERSAEQPSDHLRASLHVQMVTRWWAETVVPALCDGNSRYPACPPAACAALSVPGLPAEAGQSLWARWVVRQAGVWPRPAPQALPAHLPLPDPLLGLHLGIQARPMPRHSWAVAIWMAGVAAVAAVVGVAWHNHALVRQVSHDLQQYRAQPDLPAARSQLNADHEELARYQREGVPLNLALGLYRGAWLLDRISPWLVPGPAAHEQKQTLHLPSRALFASGSAVLNERAGPVLFQALMTIAEHHREGGLIIVSGHTDDRGGVVANLRLSRARAMAVRDWLQRTGGLPGHCFAVQGLGASQPMASNDDEQGRAANRRVDIRLVPEAGACAAAGGVPGILGAKP